MIKKSIYKRNEGVKGILSTFNGTNSSSAVIGNNLLPAGGNPFSLRVNSYSERA